MGLDYFGLFCFEVFDIGYVFGIDFVVFIGFCKVMWIVRDVFFLFGMNVLFVFVVDGG